jgi:glycosyltransferase involved in cell wall biosynthesis
MRPVPKVSVIVASYNSARYLPEAIESVLEQTFKEYEIIVINDGSTDKTIQVLEQYLPYIKLVNQENKGPGAARNAGIYSAMGDFLVFLDADDLILPRKLEAQIEYLEKFPGIDIVYSNGYYSKTDSSGSIRKRLFTETGYLRKELGTPLESLNILAVQNAFPLHAAMVKKQLVVDADGFDETLLALEDWDLWYRLAQTSTFGYLDLPLVEYRYVPLGLSSNSFRQKFAFTQMHHKILSSNSFLNLSPRIKSNFYFRFGSMDLYFSELQSAKNKFRMALAYNSSNFHAIAALILTTLLGYRFVMLLKWKNKLSAAI